MVHFEVQCLKSKSAYVAEMEDIKTLTESAKVASANLVTLLYFFCDDMSWLLHAKYGVWSFFTCNIYF